MPNLSFATSRLFGATFALICLAGIGFVLAAGCSSRPEPAAPAPEITLETAVWQLTSILVDPAPMPVPDSLPLPITLKFSKGTLEGHGGCNGYGGSYTVDANRLAVSGLLHTEMYCEGSSQWENLFFERLANSQTWEIKGESLEIQCGDLGGLVFRLNWKKRKN